MNKNKATIKSEIQPMSLPYDSTIQTWEKINGNTLINTGIVTPRAKHDGCTTTSTFYYYFTTANSESHTDLRLQPPTSTSDLRYRPPPTSATDLHRPRLPTSTDLRYRPPTTSATDLHRPPLPTSTDLRYRPPPTSATDLGCRPPLPTSADLQRCTNMWFRCECTNIWFSYRARIAFDGITISKISSMRSVIRNFQDFLCAVCQFLCMQSLMLREM